MKEAKLSCLPCASMKCSRLGRGQCSAASEILSAGYVSTHSICRHHLSNEKRAFFFPQRLGKSRRYEKGVRRLLFSLPSVYRSISFVLMQTHSTKRTPRVSGDDENRLSIVYLCVHLSLRVASSTKRSTMFSLRLFFEPSR